MKAGHWVDHSGHWTVQCSVAPKAPWTVDSTVLPRVVSKVDWMVDSLGRLMVALMDAVTAD